MQADSPFWNRRMKKKVAVAKTRNAPARKRKHPTVEVESAARGESPAANDESEVDLNAFGLSFY